MELVEFFSHRELQLPLNWANDVNFEEFVSDRLQRFLSLIDTCKGSSPKSRRFFDSIKTRRPAIDLCCNNLQRAFQATFEGQPFRAYELLRETLDTLKPEIEDRTLKQLGQIVRRSPDPKAKSSEILFRVRMSDRPQLTRNELFHIPFEDRHKVATQRYSIPGLPCLYLSGSIYACWEEMGRPPFHQLHCAAFWLKKDRQLSILDFSNRPLSIAALLSVDPSQSEEFPVDITDEYFHSSVVLWPLMAMASIVVKHRDAPYKPEYVIPQMILQWISHNRQYDGICYFSTHIDTIVVEYAHTLCNVVTPTKKIAHSGRCIDLCNSFKMTEPVAWQVLNAVNLDLRESIINRPHLFLEIVKGFDESYSRTPFGKVEFNLYQMVERVIRANDSGFELEGEICPN